MPSAKKATKAAKAAKKAAKAAAATPSTARRVDELVTGNLNDLLCVIHSTEAMKKHVNDHVPGVMMVVHRVELLNPDNAQAITGLMRTQCYDPAEVDAFLAKSQPKLILWSKYVPPGPSPIDFKDRVAQDLVIGPGVDMTREQFVAWFESTNACEFTSCTHKLVLDSLMARGAELMLYPDSHADVPRNIAYMLERVERVRTRPPTMPLQAFYLVDPAKQPNYAQRKNEGAMSVYPLVNAQNQERGMHHCLLRLTLKPHAIEGVGDDPVHYLVDLTARQISPRGDWNQLGVPFIPEATINTAKYGAVHPIAGDEALFSIDNIPAIMENAGMDGVYEQVLYHTCKGMRYAAGLWTN